MPNKKSFDFKAAIQSSGLDIYSVIEVGDANLWIPTLHLEALLNQGLSGLNLGFGVAYPLKSG